MTIDPLWLIAAFGGGAFGAAIGGQTAFIMTGFLYMVGLGGYLGGVNTAPFMDSVVFGPVFGPHIAFLGGAIAAAYAAKRGYMPAGVNGRDIVTPLAGLTELKDLYLDNNSGITDASVLKDLTKLEILTLGRTGVKDYSFSIYMPNLDEGYLKRRTA